MTSRSVRGCPKWTSCSLYSLEKSSERVGKRWRWRSWGKGRERWRRRADSQSSTQAYGAGVHTAAAEWSSLPERLTFGNALSKRSHLAAYLHPQLAAPCSPGKNNCFLPVLFVCLFLFSCMKWVLQFKIMAQRLNFDSTGVSGDVSRVLLCWDFGKLALSIDTYAHTYIACVYAHVVCVYV